MHLSAADDLKMKFSFAGSSWRDVRGHEWRFFCSVDNVELFGHVEEARCCRCKSLRTKSMCGQSTVHNVAIVAHRQILIDEAQAFVAGFEESVLVKLSS